MSARVSDTVNGERKSGRIDAYSHLNCTRGKIRRDRFGRVHGDSGAGRIRIGDVPSPIAKVEVRIGSGADWDHSIGVIIAAGGRQEEDERLADAIGVEGAPRDVGALGLGAAGI